LRPYLAAAVGLGLAAWALLPVLARQSKTRLALVGAASAVAIAGVAVVQARRIDQLAHELLFRQTATRIETLGRLYHERNPASPPPEAPFGPNAPVALIDPTTGWLLTGVVQEPLGPGMVSVAFVDDTVRSERIADLVLLQSAPLSPAQMVASLGPGLVGFATGMSGTGDQGNPAWTADALLWDVLLALGALGGVRARLPARQWLLPASVVLGTAAALIVVPGAPGNDDRHRATQTLPLLVVFACGLLAQRQAPARVRTSQVAGERVWPLAR
jgi:peptidoglycan/LPS O-acetylase OafA/YrhL